MVDFDVVELGDPGDAVEEGTLAPDFTRPLVNEEFWENRSLSDLVDDPVVLVFTTMDGAFPATYTWKELVDRSWDETYGVDVVGLSVSDPYTHQELIQERDMDYPVFSDPRNEVAREYGVVHDLDGMAGVEEPRPSIFVLDEERRVHHRWIATEWPEFPDYDEIETAIADLVE